MHSRGSKTLAIVVAALTALAACSDRIESPTEVTVQLAKGGGGPSVDAAQPNEAPQDITIDVQVIGSGFDNGSAVKVLLGGQSTPKVVTNHSTFVDRSTLTANITIAADADVALYDIEVTTRRGKKGIGSELFSVKQQGEAGAFYQISLIGDAGTEIADVSDSDVLAGSHADRAALFDLSGNVTAYLPDGGASWSGVGSISRAALFASGFGSDGNHDLLWDLTAGGVTDAPAHPELPGRSIHSINDNGMAVGQLRAGETAYDTQQPAVWELVGPGNWGVPRTLPVVPGHTNGIAWSVNNAGHAVGTSRVQADFGSGRAVIWFLDADGSVEILDLTPGHDGTRSSSAHAATEPLPDGTVLVTGGLSEAGVTYPAVWTVDLATRTLISTRRAPEAGDGRDISRQADVYVMTGLRVWKLTDDSMVDLPPSGDSCAFWLRGIDATGRVFGSAEVTTNGGSTCAISDNNIAKVGAVWTRVE